MSLPWSSTPERRESPASRSILARCWPEPGRPQWRWMLALAMAGVLVLSLLPPSIPTPSTGWDKANHGLAFVVLGWLGQWSLPGRSGGVLMGLLSYGGLIEVLQSFTPTRSAEWRDLLADAVGLAIGFALARCADAVRRRALPPQSRGLS